MDWANEPTQVYTLEEKKRGLTRNRTIETDAQDTELRIQPHATITASIISNCSY